MIEQIRKCQLFPAYSIQASVGFHFIKSRDGEETVGL